MNNPELLENSIQEQLAEELLIRSVVDREFCTEFLMNTDLSGLPLPIAPQDMTFVEALKETLDITACRTTCVSGFTIRCDGTTF